MYDLFIFFLFIDIHWIYYNLFLIPVLIQTVPSLQKIYRRLIVCNYNAFFYFRKF